MTNMRSAEYAKILTEADIVAELAAMLQVGS